MYVWLSYISFDSNAGVIALPPCRHAGTVLLISRTDRSRLFCSSIDLIESVETTTPFCTFTGKWSLWLMLLGPIAHPTLMAILVIIYACREAKDQAKH